MSVKQYLLSTLAFLHLLFAVVVAPASAHVHPLALLLFMLLPLKLLLLALQLLLLALDLFELGLRLLDFLKLLTRIVSLDSRLLFLLESLLLSDQTLLLLDLGLVLGFDALELQEAGLLGGELCIIRHFCGLLLFLFLLARSRLLTSIVVHIGADLNLLTRVA